MDNETKQAILSIAASMNALGTSVSLVCARRLQRELDSETDAQLATALREAMEAILQAVARMHGVSRG